MVLFWFIAMIMILLALWFIVPALLQTSAEARSDEARTANLLVYQDQLREMEADLKSGLLSEAQYQQDKEELERRLLEDVEDSGRTSKASKKPASRKFAYGVAIAIPVVAVTLYLLLGTPKALNPNVINPPNMGNR